MAVGAAGRENASTRDPGDKIAGRLSVRLLGGDRLAAAYETVPGGSFKVSHGQNGAAAPRFQGGYKIFECLSEPALTALVALHVSEALAVAAADAKVEFLDIFVLSQ